MQRPIVTGRRLPLVVQLGFAGSRSLFDQKAHPHIVAEDFHAAVEDYLAQQLTQLPERLEFGDEHFLCAISQIAVGADTLFMRACRSLDIPQRIFLPEHREAFLNAVGRDGVPDFTEAERVAARELLSSPHVIQERVVSDSADRQVRFEDVGREIAHVSDFLVCLVREGAVAKPGGTQDLIDRGKLRGMTVLEVRVAVNKGRPQFKEIWHGPSPFRTPQLPDAVAAVRLPESDLPPSKTSIGACCQALRDLGDAHANWQRRLFKTVALIIIGTHVLATILAVIVLATHFPSNHASHHAPSHTVERALDNQSLVATGGEAHPPAAIGTEPAAAQVIREAVIPWLLGFEVLLLAVGFGVHQYLHHSHACHRWATSRLIAEVARSVTAFGSVSVNLEHLFSLPHPAVLDHILRTINVLHLRTARADNTSWETERKLYVETRLTSPEGQIKYYTDALARAKRWLRIFHWTFLLCSGCALLATSTKLLIFTGFYRGVGPHDHGVTGTPGWLSIAVPVLAVTALSLAAAIAFTRVKGWLRGFLWAFLVCAGGALLATSAKLLVATGFLRGVDPHDHGVTGTLGGLAIALPVLAVAALSLAAAMDLEARKHTYADMLKFLNEHTDRLNQADTEPDFVRLLLETETHLLGETANWYSRRAFTGVA